MSKGAVLDNRSIESLKRNYAIDPSKSGIYVRAAGKQAAP